MKIGKINRHILLLLCWPIFDLFGITVGGIAFRLPEIYIGVYSIFNLIAILRRGRLSLRKNYKTQIIGLLLLNLLLAIGVTFVNWESVSTSFAVKYFVRNAFYIVFLFSCVAAECQYFTKEAVSLMAKWSVVLSFLCLVFNIITGLQIYMNHLITPIGMKISIAGLNMVRFSSTTFEPGLAILILAFPLFYFTRTYGKHKVFFWLSFIMLLLSYSTTSFIIIGLNFIILLIEKKKLTVKTIFKIFMWAVSVMIVVVVAMNNSEIYSMVMYQYNKTLGFLTNGTSGILLWSSNDRLNQYSLVWNYFCTGNFYQILFGRGTGSYANYVSHLTGSLALTNAEEAYTIYLSTLADRGVIGFVIVLLLSVKLFRHKEKTMCLEKKTLLWGIFVHFVGWIVMGNFWIYTCWLMMGIYFYMNDYTDKEMQT